MSLLDCLGMFGRERSREELLDTVDALVIGAANSSQAKSYGIKDIALSVYDIKDGTLLHRVDTGSASERRLNVASVSKLMSGLVLLKCVSEGHMSLESTTSELLGWDGEIGLITLRQLGSMTSGLIDDDNSLYDGTISLAETAAAIRDRGLQSQPGKRFHYKQTDWQVAGRMAEVATGRTWAELFNALKDAIGLGYRPDLKYRCAREGGRDTHSFLYNRRIEFHGDTLNPMLGGGLWATEHEIKELYLLAANEGRTRTGTQIIRAELIKDVMFAESKPCVSMSREPQPAAFMSFMGYRYGFGCWLERSVRFGREAHPCVSFSSPGIYGTTPWIDMGKDSGGYVGVICSEGNMESATRLSYILKMRLQPLVRRALASPCRDT